MKNSNAAQAFRATHLRSSVLTQHRQNRHALSTDNTLTARTTKFCNIWCCVSNLYTPSLSHIKNNSFLAILSTVHLPPGRSTKKCECHKSDFSTARAAVAPWASQVFWFNSTAASLQPNSHRKPQCLNTMLSRTPKVARSPHPPKLCSLDHLIL